MRLRVTARAGEIERRAEDLVKAVKALIAKKTGRRPKDERDTNLLIPALREGKAKGLSQVEQIRAAAAEKIAEIVG